MSPTIAVTIIPSSIYVEVNVRVRLRDKELHRLRVRSGSRGDAGFEWSVEFCVNSPSEKSSGVSLLGPDTDEIEVEWDGAIAHRQDIREAGRGPAIEVLYRVRPG
ncbi:MAG: hypothetical protein KGM24_14005 [Elusimicrobia bacterium]|nr:hypothetical protein [Elusimicrobiota bacterium]